MFYIYYLVWFQKDRIETLINSGNKINAISPEYISQLGSKTCYTNFSAQKINNSTFKILK